MKQSELKLKNIEEQRPIFAAMIGSYVGSETGGNIDNIFVFNRCWEFAKKYDFVLISSSEGWLIDTEVAREDAEKFTKELVRDFC